MNQYDIQIAELTRNPSKIGQHWLAATGLFKFIGNDIPFIAYAGCLTTIRCHSNKDVYPIPSKAIINGEVDEELTQAIATDERIPKYYTDIKVEHLPVFKEWQEKIDAMQID